MISTTSEAAMLFRIFDGARVKGGSPGIADALRLGLANGPSPCVATFDFLLLPVPIPAEIVTAASFGRANVPRPELVPFPLLIGGIVHHPVVYRGMAKDTANDRLYHPKGLPQGSNQCPPYHKRKDPYSLLLHLLILLNSPRTQR